MNQRGLGTSLPEQALFYYIKKYFCDVKNRIKIENVEADIYIPSINCVVEVDGGFWHNNKVEIDDAKNVLFNKLGLFVIRVREKGLPHLKSFKGEVIVGNISLSLGKQRFLLLLKKVIVCISKQVDSGELKRELLKFNITIDEFDKELPKIFSSLTTNKIKHPNILDCAGGQLWDYEKNGNLNPLTISYDEFKNTKLHFICSDETQNKRSPLLKMLELNKWCVNPTTLDLKDRDEKLIFEFKRSHCTMMHYCRKRCNSEKEFYKYMISNFIPIYIGSLDEERLAKGVFSFPKKLTYAILSNECPDLFLESIKSAYRYLSKPFSGAWAKTSKEKNDYEKALKIISEPFNINKYPILRIKYVGRHQI